MPASAIIDPAVIHQLNHGGVIAYPTEAVYGLGCDPDNQQAVLDLLAIKQRPVSKGLILIAADFEQLLPYINDELLTDTQKADIFARWPGPFTWVFPAASTTPAWLTGDFATIAVRVSAHPVVQALCRQFAKPLVSTSANLTGQPAITDFDLLVQQMQHRVAAIVPGTINTNAQPSTIIDAMTGTIYRD